MGSSNGKLQALHLAVIEDNAEEVRAILEENGLDVNARGNSELTAVHIAISNGALKTLRVLLESGRCDFSTSTPSRETPLILAAAKDQEDIALYLLENYSDNTLHLTAADRTGLQVVHHASMRGMERLVRAVVKRGVSEEARGGKLRHTPLMLAAQYGQEDVVGMLVQSGCNVTSVDLAKMTALHHACMADSEPCAAHLLESQDTVVDAEDISGCTPLVYCLKNKNKALEKLLVSHGANLTAALDVGFSELCYHTLQEER